MKKLMIYGATGYVGRMAAEYAKAQGLDIVIAGRSHDKVRAFAAELDAPYRVFAPDARTAESLDGVDVLVNFAGPFAQTADALMRACIKAGVDYLDITAEINVYRLAERLDAEAAKSGVMLLPGVGWDVVPTDCLAVHVARRVQDPQSLSIALRSRVPCHVDRPAVSAKSLERDFWLGLTGSSWQRPMRNHDISILATAWKSVRRGPSVIWLQAGTPPVFQTFPCSCISQASPFPKAISLSFLMGPTRNNVKPTAPEQWLKSPALTAQLPVQ